MVLALANVSNLAKYSFQSFDVGSNGTKVMMLTTNATGAQTPGVSNEFTSASTC